MRSQELGLQQYDTDKITNRYLETYDPILEPWLKKEVKLLELGVYSGGSLFLWRDYFQLGTIVGVDIRLQRQFVNEERIQVFEGSQADTAFLSEVARKTAPEGFDIIIDDASHLGELTKTAFWHLFEKHLKAGGLYVIEDWGTGYWSDWPDGMTLAATPPVTHESPDGSNPGVGSSRTPLYRVWRRVISLGRVSTKTSKKVPFACHSYGMVGFVKELVDEQGAADLTRASLLGKPKRRSKFDSLLITPSIVFIKKGNLTI